MKYQDVLKLVQKTKKVEKNKIKSLLDSNK
jgi:hypothetical protein